jgi:hypothetical protein
MVAAGGRWNTLIVVFASDFRYCGAKFGHVARFFLAASFFRYTTLV